MLSGGKVVNFFVVFGLLQYCAKHLVTGPLKKDFFAASLTYVCFLRSILHNPVSWIQIIGLKWTILVWIHFLSSFLLQPIFHTSKNLKEAKNQRTFILRHTVNVLAIHRWKSLRPFLQNIHKDAMYLPCLRIEETDRV